MEIHGEFLFRTFLIRLVYVEAGLTIVVEWMRRNLCGGGGRQRNWKMDLSTTASYNSALFDKVDHVESGLTVVV